MSKKAAEHHKKAAELLAMLLSTTVKRPNITKADITRRRRITLTLRGRTRFIVGITLKKQQRPMPKSTARNSRGAFRAK